MPQASFPARPVRSQYRHELRTLTYLTLDDGNGGIVRNLNHDGAALRVVSQLQPEQRVRLRFQLKGSRLRPLATIETCGQVTWADPAGACGIRFIDLPDRSRNQIDEWILSDLFNSLAAVTNTAPIFEPFPTSAVSDEIDDPDEIVSPDAIDDPDKSDGLILSAAPRPAIRLEPMPPTPAEPARPRSTHAPKDDPSVEVVPQQPTLPHLSARRLAWAVDALAITAGLLLFAVIFLSVAHEVPEWRLTLSLLLLTVPFFAGAYWTLFALFGGPTLGNRVAQLAHPSHIGEKKSRQTGLAKAARPN